MKINKRLSFALLFISLLFIVMISMSSCGVTTTIDSTKELVGNSDSALPNKYKYADCKIKTFIGAPENYTDGITNKVNNWLLKQTNIEIIDIQICDSTGNNSMYRTNVILIIYREVIN